MTASRTARHLPRTRPARRTVLLAVLAGILVLVAVVGLVAHFRPPGSDTTLLVSVLSPYLMLAAPLGLLVALFSRVWLLAAAAAALTVVLVVLQAPLFVAQTAPADATPVSVMTSNLRLGLGDPQAVVAAVHRHHVDVLMLEELTPQEQDRLVAAGLDRALPHHVSRPGSGATGTGLWSRYPLHDEHFVPGYDFAFVTATTRLPSVDRPVRLVALHLVGPVPDPVPWRAEISALPTTLATLARSVPTVIVGGDFNSTPDVAEFRAVLVDGYADGAAQAGAGITRSWPANRWFPPFMAIDHVLTRQAVATSASTVEIPGSDHRALVVRVAVARDLTSRGGA